MAQMAVGSASGLSLTVNPVMTSAPDEPVDPVLHRGPGDPEYRGEGGDGEARVLAQKRHEPTINIVHVHWITIC